jgi:hypothetical protein
MACARCAFSHQRPSDQVNCSRLRGSAVVYCRLKIESGTECVFAEMLVGGVETTIEFAALSEDGVTLTFDAFEVDAVRREIAFFITHTNLFSEDDL